MEQDAEALTSSSSSRQSHRRSPSMLLSEGINRPQRTIKPDDISSLFTGSSSGGGGGVGTSAKKGTSAAGYEDDDDEDFDYYGEDTPRGVITEQSVVEVAAVVEIGTVEDSTADSRAFKELVALEEEAKNPSPVVTQVVSTDDDNEDEEEMGYLQLGRKLNKAQTKTVMDTMSMAEADIDTSGAASLASPRVVKYDPTETFRGDPMKYGAYRRWKLAETEDGKPRLDSKGRPMKMGKTKTPTKGGYQKGDYKIEGQQGRTLPGKGNKSALGKKKTAKGEGDSPMDQFMKTFGSGAGTGGSGRDGSVGGSTGFGEPPANKKSVQPQKAPTKKNKKRVITPDDINSLFGGQKTEMMDDDEEDEEEEEEEAGAGMAAVPAAAPGGNVYNPMMMSVTGPNDEVKHVYSSRLNNTLLHLCSARRTQYRHFVFMLSDSQKHEFPIF